MSSFAANVLRILRGYRQALKSGLPYVRRREYRRLTQRYDQCMEAIHRGLEPATDTLVTPVIPVRALPHAELCLFVSHAAVPTLKAHVVEHALQLLDAGIAVVLLVNTDLAPASITVPPPLQQRLSGLYVRKNTGYDFAAWAHGWSLCGRPTHLERLLLVNDSIIGPLDSVAFTALMKRLRASRADVVGLTEHTQTQPHLQSFFLAFNRKALQSEALQRFLDRLYALPTKEMVIDAYETRLTQRLRAAGLSTEALFPALADGLWCPNDIYRWADLIRIGFPFIKSSMLPRVAHTADARALVPTRFLDPPR